jgi:hypothetical protein
MSMSMSVSVLVDFAGSRWFESCTEPLARCVFDGDQQRVGSASWICESATSRIVECCKATSSSRMDFSFGSGTRSECEVPDRQK